MAQWVILFAPSDADTALIGAALSDRGLAELLVPNGDAIADLRRGEERVEIVLLDSASTLAEYGMEELAGVLLIVPRPLVMRVQFFRGTSLISDVLQALDQIPVPLYVDNDHGVILPLRAAVMKGIPRFLASRGGRFVER